MFFVTYLTILIIFFFVFFVIFQFFMSGNELDLDKIQTSNPKDFISNYSFLFFCFAGQQGIIIVYNENNQQGTKNMKNIFKWIFGFTTFLYLLLGIVGYLTFYDNPEVTEVTYLGLFQSNSFLILIAQSSMLITSMIAYVFLFKPTRDLIEDFMLKRVLNDKKEREFGI